MINEYSELLLKCRKILCTEESPDEKLFNDYLSDGSSEELILLDGEHLQIEMSTDSEMDTSRELFQESSLTENLPIGSEIEVRSENDTNLNLTDIQIANNAHTKNNDVTHYNRKLNRKTTPNIKSKFGSARTRLSNIRKTKFTPAHSSVPITYKGLGRDIYEPSGLAKLFPNKKCKVEYIQKNFYTIMNLAKTSEVTSTSMNMYVSVMPMNLTFEGDALENKNQCENISNVHTIFGNKKDKAFPDKSNMESKNNVQSSINLVLRNNEKFKPIYQEKLILIQSIALSRMPGFLNIYRFYLQYIKYFPFIVLLDFRQDCPVKDQRKILCESERWSFISTWRKGSTKQSISGLCFVARRATPFSLNWIQRLLRNDPDGNNGLDIQNLIQIKLYNNQRKLLKSCSVNSKLINLKEIDENTQCSADSNKNERTIPKNMNQTESYLEIYKKYLSMNNNNDILHITKSEKPSEFPKSALSGRNKISSNQNMFQNLQNMVKATTNLNNKFRNLGSKRLSNESVREDVKPIKITKTNRDIKDDQEIKKLRNNRGLVVNKQNENKSDTRSQKLNIDCLQKVMALQDISITIAKPKPTKIEAQKSDYDKFIPNNSLHLEDIVFPGGTTNINSTSKLVVYLNRKNNNNNGNDCLARNISAEDNPSVNHQCKFPLIDSPNYKKVNLIKVYNNLILMQPHQFVEYSPIYNSAFLIGPSDLPPGRYYLHPMPRGGESFNNIMLKVELMHKYNLGYEKISTEELMRIPDFEFLPTNVQMSDI